jgi:hypothetical protein
MPGSPTRPCRGAIADGRPRNCCLRKAIIWRIDVRTNCITKELACLQIYSVSALCSQLLLPIDAIIVRRICTLSAGQCSLTNLADCCTFATLIGWFR